MTNLVVVRPFGSYQTGQEITDAATVLSIEAGPNKANVVQVAGTAADGSVTIIPSQPNAVTSVLGLPDITLAVTFGYALDLTSTPATLYKWSGTAWTVAIQAGGGTSAPVLATLGLSLTSAVVGTPWTATISGQTAGSQPTATSSDGTALTISGTTLSGNFAAAGTPTITLIETLAGATGSPKSTPLTVTVSASGPDLTNPANTELLHNL